MVKKYTCTFCGTDIEPGTGSVYVKNDGSLFYLCSSKCWRNQILLKRRPRRLKWTEVYEERTRRRAHAAKKSRAKPTPKAKKAEAKPKVTPKEEPSKPKIKQKGKKKTKKETKATEKKTAAKSETKKPAKKSKSESKSK
ncbi:MAG: 50S ribosomal protein L24e [Promethearchaeota archaeon]